jgi:hypothetical protein
MTAAGTEAVQFETVGLDREAVARGDFLLEPFDIAIFKLHDPAAVGADQVVMVALVRYVVVLGLRPEVPGLRQTGFAKEIERPVDRGQPQVWILARELMVQLFRGDMFLLEKGVKNEFALAGVLELMLPQVVFEDAHFFLMLRHVRQPLKESH